ncbi:MAG: hypothetical protein AAGK04_04220 [Planctomycetota bacterium]
MWVRAIGGVLVGGMVALCALLVVVIVQLRSAPGWWTEAPTAPGAVAQAAATGEAIEHGISRVLHAPRSPDPMWDGADGSWRSEAWGVTLASEDANAWLSSRLPMWLSSGDEAIEWPEGASPVRLAFEAGSLRLGVRVPTEDGDRVLSATVRPYVGADGGLWLPARAVHVGRLTIPATWVLDQAERERRSFVPKDWADRPETRAMFDVFAGERPVLYDPVFKLGDGRRVRVLNVTSQGGRMVVTCRTERGTRQAHRR